MTKQEITRRLVDLCELYRIAKAPGEYSQVTAYGFGWAQLVPHLASSGIMEEDPETKILTHTFAVKSEIEGSPFFSEVRRYRVSLSPGWESMAPSIYYYHVTIDLLESEVVDDLEEAIASF